MEYFHEATAAAAALGVTVASMLALRPIAYAVDLVDRPGGHKTHHGEVPVVGGLAMLLGLVVGICASPATLHVLSSFLVSGALLVVVGMLDDRFGLPASARLVVQFAAVLPMFFGGDVRLENLGSLIGPDPIHAGSASLFLTAFVTLAAINSFNMLDGLDGLAGGVALVSIGWEIVAGISTSSVVSLTLAAVLLGCVAGFLVFNLPIRANRRMRCFMGDAGSTLLGFSLAWLCIEASQGPAATIVPITMVWLVGVPATDLVWTTVRRLVRGQSPLRPDNEHLHHSLRTAGLGVRAVFGIMLFFAVSFGLVGPLLNAAHVSERISLLLLLFSGAGLVFLCRSARSLVRFAPVSLRRAPDG